MKKIYFFLLAVLLCGGTMVYAAPYGILINGTTTLEAVAQDATDFQGREQFKVSCVELAQDDKVQLIDLSNNATWMSAIDPYGEYQKFTGGKEVGYLICNTAGIYDFYIKLKYEDDLVYIGTGENCNGSTDPTPDPNPEPDPNATDTVFFVNAAHWAKVNVYVWNDTENNSWPGQAATKTTYQLQNADVYYFASVPGKYPNCIFNDGTNQTSDLVWTSGKYFYNNKWYTREELEAGTIKPTPTTSVPAACPDVMLQGFYWDSNQDDKGHGNTRWTTLQAQATEIAAYFDLVWLPPSAKSSGGVGYHPKQYNNQNSDWGKRTELEKLIQTLHGGGAKVIADIVINHIDAQSTWCDFFPQNFGEYGLFEMDGSYICQGDEMNFDPQAGACNGQATGPADDGYGSEANYGAARDLAHDSEKVREMCRAYTKWMIHEMNYDGFRYDYCKGFHTSHINDYNANAGAYFSVMEYWDGNANTLWNRISEASENTLTFDFGVKYEALNRGIAAGNYNGCKAPGLLGMGKGKWAVTFVDSHDSYQRDDNEFCGKGNSMKNKNKLMQANAFILCMPGVPCVFYPHWKEFKSEIGPMVLARKAVGVHSESSVSDEATASGYRATVVGTNGTLILELGDKVSGSQAGYTKAASGSGYAIWTKTNNAVAPELIVSPASTTYKTESLKVEMQTVGGSGASTIYYTLDGTDPTTSSTKQTYSTPLTIQGTTTLKAYAVAGGVATAVQTHTYTYQEPQETPLTVKFYPPTSWEEVYLYAWDSNGATVLGGWPGIEWKTKDNSGWLYHIFDHTLREVNIIFNNGAGVQSSDILLDQDACYKWDDINGMETLSDECTITDIPFQLIVTPEGKVFKTETLEITMKTVGEQGSSVIYYTLDGTDPKSSSTKTTFQSPIIIKQSTTLKAYAQDGGKETDVQTHVYTYETPQATPITVAFRRPTEWAKVCLYSWITTTDGTTTYTGEWPGTAMTNVNDNGLYYHQFDASLKEINFIFNNGAGVQSADLWTDEDVCYGWENAKAVVIDCTSTGVEDILQEDIPMLNIDCPMYNILGQQVNATYRGIVIQNGHKYLR